MAADAHGDRLQACGEIGERRLEQSGFADRQVILNHEPRNAQAAGERDTGIFPVLIVKRSIDLVRGRVDEVDGLAVIQSGLDIDVNFLADRIARLEAPTRQRGDRPVEDGCVLDTAHAVDGHPNVLGCIGAAIDHVGGHHRLLALSVLAGLFAAFAAVRACRQNDEAGNKRNEILCRPADTTAHVANPPLHPLPDAD